jgi:hypothetical protein
MRKVLGELLLLAALLSFLIFLDLMEVVRVLEKISDAIIFLDSLPQGFAIIFGLLTLLFIAFAFYLLTPQRSASSSGAVVVKKNYTLAKENLERMLTNAANSLPHCSASCEITRTTPPIEVKCVVHNFSAPPVKVSKDLTKTLLRVLKKEVGIKKATVLVLFEGGERVEDTVNLEPGGLEKSEGGGEN